MTKVTHIVVHYSATYADQDLTARDIDKMHRGRGWQMVGYHYVIRRDGTIERGRPEGMVGICGQPENRQDWHLSHWRS